VQVILTQDVEKLGDSGTLQEVKPGYARKMYLRSGGGGPHGTQGEGQDSMHWWVK